MKQLTPFEQQYLERMGVHKLPGTLSADTLVQLQKAHLFSIPFEDLDVHWQQEIKLDKKSLFQKIVAGRRGGYCYELNGIFYYLLQSLGFEVNMIAGRVIKGKKTGPAYDHMVLLVTIDGQQWLTDVGFGDFSLQPICLNENVQYDGRNYYRIGKKEHEHQLYLTAEKWNNNKKQFIPEYLFTTEPCSIDDFADMNQYQQSDPDSYFVQNLLCSIPVDDGRVSIINNRLFITHSDGRNEIHLYTDAERQEMLSRFFGIRRTAMAM